MKWLVVLLVLLVSCAPAQVKNVDMVENGQYEVIASSVTYFNDVYGYFAKPVDAGTYPGVILIHEWWGLNDNIKDMTEKLASEGYVVLAVDLYEGKVATTQDEARQYTGSLNQTQAISNMKAAVAYLRAQGAPKVGSLGWCFGGGQSLQLALNDGIDATAIYYGRLVTNESQLNKIQWPVLGVFGGKDTGIPVESVNAFDAALDKLNIENEIYIYPNVGHAFANPSGANYAPTETEDAWAKTIAFLNKHLK
jgi:carboxymethylenebutenolidase